MQRQRCLTLGTAVDDIRRRYSAASINFPPRSLGLKMPVHREIEHRMPPLFNKEDR